MTTARHVHTADPDALPPLGTRARMMAEVDSCEKARASLIGAIRSGDKPRVDAFKDIYARRHVRLADAVDAWEDAIEARARHNGGTP
jgi:hypothetical protein